MITYGQILTLFNNIAVAHKSIKDFQSGEFWEVEGNIKPGIIYPMLYAVPLTSETKENTKIRTFTLMVFSQVKKDKSNEEQILSDSEQDLDEVIRIIKNESEYYELLNEPVLNPFKGKLGDWVAGWRADVEIQTDLNNNYCDIPKLSFTSPTNL